MTPENKIKPNLLSQAVSLAESDILTSDSDVVSRNPIGVFDSGVGGLSILKEMQTVLPCEDILYVGDIRYAPYGDKSLEFILQRAITICDFLIAKQVKAIVVACNTATVSVVTLLREKYNTPIVGVEPAVKPAALYSKTGHVGVLATERTINSDSFKSLTNNYQKLACFHTVVAHGLVEQIEKAQLSSLKTSQLLENLTAPLIDKNIDSIVLGCTHYPFIKPLLKSVLKSLIADPIMIFDTATPVANELKRRLITASLITDSQVKGKTVFFSSADPISSAQVMSQLLGQTLIVQPLKPLLVSSFNC